MELILQSEFLVLPDTKDQSRHNFFIGILLSLEEKNDPVQNIVVYVL